MIDGLAELFTPVSAYAFMVFTLLAAPCVAAIGAIRREMGSWKWTFIAIGYQTGLAYIMALIVYQVGSLIFNSNSQDTNIWATVAISVVLLVLFALAIKKTYKDSKKGACSGCSGCSDKKDCNM